MDIKDLNKPQLLLLALLVSFITSVATGITVVALMDQAPKSVSTPINRIIKQTVEKIVPIETKVDVLSDEDKELLTNLKTVQNLSAEVYLKGETENKLLGTGVMLGDTKVVINSDITPPKEGEVYLVKTIFGENIVSKIIPGEDFTLVEFTKLEKNEQASLTETKENNAPTQ